MNDIVGLVGHLIGTPGSNLTDFELCRADITTKNPKKVKKYMQNFERVDELMKNVQERDAFRAFQSPVRGDEIMELEVTKSRIRELETDLNRVRTKQNNILPFMSFTGDKDSSQEQEVA